MRTLPPSELLLQLPSLQKLLGRLMDTMPRGAAARHYVVQSALLKVATESFQVCHRRRVYSKLYAGAIARPAVVKHDSIRITITLTKVMEVLCVCCTTDFSVPMRCWLSCDGMVLGRYQLLGIPVLRYELSPDVITKCGRDFSRKRSSCRVSCLRPY